MLIAGVESDDFPLKWAFCNVQYRNEAGIDTAVCLYDLSISEAFSRLQRIRSALLTAMLRPKARSLLS